jgi:hypothetical protein
MTVQKKGTLTMKNLLITAALVVSVAGCSSPLRTADYADAASTALVIATGGVELNPLLGALGDDLAAPLSLVVSAGARYAIDEFIAPEHQEAYHHVLTTAKVAVTCNNLGVIFGFEPVGLLVVAIGCGAAYHYAANLENGPG